MEVEFCEGVSVADERIEVVCCGGDVVGFTPVGPGDRASSAVARPAASAAPHRLDQVAPAGLEFKVGVGRGVPRTGGGGVVGQEDGDARAVAVVIRAGQCHVIDRLLDSFGGQTESFGDERAVGDGVDEAAQVAQEGDVVGNRIGASFAEHVDVVVGTGDSRVDEVTQCCQQQGVAVGRDCALGVPAPEVALVLVLVAVDEPGRQGLGPDRLGILLQDVKQRRVVVSFGSDDFLAGDEDIGVIGEAEADFGQCHQAGIEGDDIEIGTLRIGQHLDELGRGQVIAGGSVEIVVVESPQAAAVVPHHQRVVFGGGLVDRPVDEFGQCLGVTGILFTEQFELGRDHVGVGIG